MYGHRRKQGVDLLARVNQHLFGLHQAGDSASRVIHIQQGRNHEVRSNQQSAAVEHTQVVHESTAFLLRPTPVYVRRRSQGHAPEIRVHSLGRKESACLAESSTYLAGVSRAARRRSNLSVLSTTLTKNLQTPTDRKFGSMQLKLVAHSAV